MLNQLLSNKVILISSGTKGVGRALVAECAKCGARVVFSGRDLKAGKEIIDELSLRNLDATFIPADMTSVPDIRDLFSGVLEKHGRLDGYVNYAGVTPVASLTETTEEVFDSVMGVNTKGAFFSTACAVEAMRKTGGGSIALFGSAHSWGGQKDRAAYAVSKGALYALFEHISKNYATENIRCNYITMGWTATEGEISLRASQGLSLEELQSQAAEILPMGRMCTPEDVIPGVIYLISDYSQMVTGANLRCTAGEFI